MAAVSAKRSIAKTQNVFLQKRREDELIIGDQLFGIRLMSIHINQCFIMF